MMLVMHGCGDAHNEPSDAASSDTSDGGDETPPSADGGIEDGAVPAERDAASLPMDADVQCDRTAKASVGRTTCDGPTEPGSDASAAAESEAGQPKRERIVAWGDSLTVGYAGALAAATGREVLNFGISGQTSRGIAARQGGAPAFMTLAGNEIPVAGRAQILAAEVWPLVWPGTSLGGSLAGVEGMLFHRAGEDGGPAFFEFVAAAAEARISVYVPPNTPFVPDTEQYRGDTSVLWLGRNNYPAVDQVVADVAACVAHLASDRFLVLSILNGTYPGEESGGLGLGYILDINGRLAAAYGERYVDVRTVLVDAYDPSSPGDVQNHADDVPPASLRHDTIHLNWAGTVIVAEAVAARLDAFGW